MNICTTSDILRPDSIQEAALTIANKVAYDKAKGFSRSWDGKTYWEFAGNLPSQIRKIQAQLSSKKYQFKPTLRKTRRIGSKRRHLHISTWPDKLVENWLSRALNVRFKSWFAKGCYAYKPGDALGVCHENISNSLSGGASYIIRRDIREFFGTIDHSDLMEKLSGLIKDQYLLELLRARVEYKYYDNDYNVWSADKGVPFGSALACVLSNIALTPIDRLMQAFNVDYFRYADDYLIISNDPSSALGADRLLHRELEAINLSYNSDKRDNMSFRSHPDFVCSNKFKYLGIEHRDDGVRRLPVEKRRKIINICRRALAAKRPKSAEMAVETVNTALKTRIRNAAIIDYYLEVVTDERQLSEMDIQIRELIVSVVLKRKFRRSHYKQISPKHLHDFGLISLRHRNKLIRGGKIKVSFLSLFNRLQLSRHLNMINRRADRLDQVALARKQYKSLKAQASS